VLDEVAFHEQAGYHTLDTFLTAEIHTGRARVLDHVAGDGQPVDAHVVDRDGDTAQPAELALGDGDPGPREHPDAVHVVRGRPERQAAERHVIRLDVDDVGGRSGVDDPGTSLRLARPHDDRGSGPAAPADRARPLIVTRMDEQLLSRLERVDRRAQILTRDHLGGGGRCRSPSRRRQERGQEHDRPPRRTSL